MNLDSGNRVPALRFKDEMGKEYPDWEELTLACIGKIIGGGTPDTSRKDFWNGSIVWYTPVEIEEKYSTISLRTISEDGLKNSSAKLLPKGSVLFTSRATIGKVTIVSCECTTNQGFQSFVVDNSNFSNEFLYYWLTNNVHEFFRRANGSTYLEITGKEIKSIPYIVPLLQEQQKIANFLSSVDTRIEQLENKKSLLEQFKKGLMQKLFSQEVRFKDDQGEEYPEWEVMPIAGIGKIIGGGTPDTTDQSLWNGSIVWYTPVEIHEKYSSDSIRRISGKGLKKSSARLLPAGTVLFTTRATIGKATITTSECTTNQGFQSFIVDKLNHSNEFLYYWLLKNIKEFVRRANGSTYLEVSAKEIKKIPIVVPNLQEQQEIANFLSSVDRKIKLIAEKIIKTRAFKKGLLQQMFV